MEAILLSIALDQEKRLYAVEKVLQNAGVLCEIARMDSGSLSEHTGDDPLWLIDRNQSHYRLTDEFAPAFYVSGSEEKLARLQDAAEKQTTDLRTELTERIDLWLNATRPVLKVSLLFTHQ